MQWHEGGVWPFSEFGKFLPVKPPAGLLAGYTGSWWVKITNLYGQRGFSQALPQGRACRMDVYKTEAAEINPRIREKFFHLSLFYWSLSCKSSHNISAERWNYAIPHLIRFEHCRLSYLGRIYFHSDLNLHLEVKPVPRERWILSLQPVLAPDRWLSPGPLQGTFWLEAECLNFPWLELRAGVNFPLSPVPPGDVEVLGLNQEPFRREEGVLGRQPALSRPVNILTISKVIFLLLLLFLKYKSNLGFLQGLKHSLVLDKFIPPNSTLWRPPQELLEARYHAWLF